MLPIVKKCVLLAALMAPAAVSCGEKEGVREGDNIPGTEDVTLTVSVAPLSRAALQGDKVTWETGDSISVFDGYLPRIFKCTSPGATGTFKGKACPADSYSAVWPASSAFAYAPGKFSVVIPSAQLAKKGSFSKEAYPVFGSAPKGLAITLQPIVSLVEVEIAPGNEALGQISLSNQTGEILSGRIIITTDPAGTPPVILGQTASVSLLPEGESFEPGTYYLAMHPAELKQGLDVRIESAFYAPFTKHLDGVSDKMAKGAVLDIGDFNPADNLVEEEADDASADPVSAYGYDFSRLTELHHPRILMTANDFISLKKKVFIHPEDNPTLVQLHNLTMAFADVQLVKDTEIPLPDGTKNWVLSNVARESLERLAALCYGYRMTGENRYLARARQDLARVSSFTTWYPSSYLSTAELMVAASIAYDWLYYDLTLEERTAARNALETLGLGSCPEHHYGTNTNNWNQVCNAGLLCAGMAVYEKNKALGAAHIDASTAANLAALDVIYGQDGSYPEGYGYWEYGTNFQAILTQALLVPFGKAGGIEKHPGLLKTGEYLLYMADAIGSFPYSDGGRASSSPRLAQWWLAGLTHNPSLLLNEYRHISLGSYKNCSRILPMAVTFLAHAPELEGGVPQAPASEMWSGNGVVPMVLVRRGWNNDESDIYLAMKGGPANTNHGHMDAGSFVYDRNGVRWVDEILLTGGYAPAEDGLEAVGGNFWAMSQSSLRWDVFVMNNLAHPTLSFENNDGSLSGKVHETDHCATGKATLTSTISNATGTGGVFDMTPVFKGQVASATRQALLQPDGDALVTDVITALPGQDALLQWRVPTKVNVSIDDDCIEMTSNGKEMYMFVSCSDSNLVPQFKDFGNSRPVGQWGWVARDWDQTNSAFRIVGYTLTIPAGSTVTLNTHFSVTAPGQGSGTVENEKPQM